MKYVAFENTYNEQIYDSDLRTITWRDGAKIEDVEVDVNDDEPSVWRAA